MNKLLKRIANWFIPSPSLKEPTISEKRADFLRDVLHEVEMLRQHATPEEIAKLNLENFCPTSKSQCIYGQMTGTCISDRARELMAVACIRCMNLPTTDEIDLQQGRIDIDDPEFVINGEYTEQTWKEVSVFNVRNFQTMTVLEAYIITRYANIKGIMAYLKGEADTLSL